MLSACCQVARRQFCNNYSKSVPNQFGIKHVVASSSERPDKTNPYSLPSRISTQLPPVVPVIWLKLCAPPPTRRFLFWAVKDRDKGTSLAVLWKLIRLKIHLLFVFYRNGEGGGEVDVAEIIKLIQKVHKQCEPQNWRLMTLWVVI